MQFELHLRMIEPKAIGINPLGSHAALYLPGSHGNPAAVDGVLRDGRYAQKKLRSMRERNQAHPVARSLARSRNPHSGRRTVSITWMTPLLASTSACVTLALFIFTPWLESTRRSPP